MSNDYRRIVGLGSGRVEILGLPRGILNDMYYFFLNGSWRSFYAFVFVSYLLLNLLFASLYVLGGDCVANAHGFLDYVFFSLQTMATIGYGILAPQTTYAHVLVGFESLFGILSMATITGVTFSKFSRPRARVIFSAKAVVTQHDGIPTLMFRVMNARSNQIAEATLTLVMVRPGRTKEGRPFNRLVDLTMARDKSPVFSLTWTAMHPITDWSPIKPDSSETLQSGGVTFVCSLTGYDPSTGQTIHARHVYQAVDVKFNHRLVDVFHLRGEGKPPLVDYTKFHDTEPEAPL